MDTLWAFRNACVLSTNASPCINPFILRYNTAFQLKKKQDEYCEKAEAGQWIGLGDFPESLQWEALVDVSVFVVGWLCYVLYSSDFDGSYLGAAWSRQGELLFLVRYSFVPTASISRLTYTATNRWIWTI